MHAWELLFLPAFIAADKRDYKKHSKIPGTSGPYPYRVPPDHLRTSYFFPVFGDTGPPVVPPPLPPPLPDWFPALSPSNSFASTENLLALLSMDGSGEPYFAMQDAMEKSRSPPKTSGGKSATTPSSGQRPSAPTPSPSSNVPLPPSLSSSS